MTRPAWAEVSHGRLQQNYRLLRRLAGPGVELMAVVKANAYGHGGAAVAPLLAAEGADWFGVTSVEEAAELRCVCAKARILAMSGLWRGEADAVIEYRITPSVWEPLHLELLEEAALARGLGRGTVPVHLEIDTGMSRQGVQVSKLNPLLDRFGAESPLRLEAVMTHFHSADNPEATDAQMREFAAAVDVIARRGLRPAMLSAGSSVSVLHQDTDAVTEMAQSLGARRMFRAGIALYGYPSRGNGRPEETPAPVLAWKTRVISLREVAAGATAGYDATFRAQRQSRLALLPVGYADGLSRLLSNRGSVLVRGQRVPIAGRISMDQTIVDVTEIPGVTLGDEVVLIGQQKNGQQENETITAEDLAESTGTISYEVLCAIAARVPRVMVD